MDSTDEEFYGSTTSFTTKGRRTKRQRTATTTATATTTSSYGGCVEISYGSSTSAAAATPSPSTPDDQDIISQQGMTTEEEDLDMANCLILLAQGAKKARSSKPRQNNNSNTNNSSTGVTSSSAVIGVYECKTCNKTFTSFQALGGHRTSHKKIIAKPLHTQPPNNPAENLESPDFLPIPPPKEAPEKPSTNRHNPEKSRVHECTICGSEFSSGQALGGHMRRHRPIVNHTSTTAIVVNENGPIVEVGQDELGGPRNILSLDLNLPAPNEHEHEHEHQHEHEHEHDQQLVVVDASTNSTSHMVETKFHVIPTPALLDCHY